MSGLFKALSGGGGGKRVPPPKVVQLPAPKVTPAIVTPSDTAAPQTAFLRRRKKGAGLAGLVLSPLGGAGANPSQPQANKQTLGGA
jgi:hypothetical protein